MKFKLVRHETGIRNLYWCKKVENVYPLLYPWFKDRGCYMGYLCEGCGQHFKHKNSYLKNHIFVVSIKTQ